MQQVKINFLKPFLFSIILSSNVSANICYRTPQVRNEILRQVRDFHFFNRFIHCVDVKKKHLAKIEVLNLSHKEISSLDPHDFEALTSLTELHLSNNNLSEEISLFLGSLASLAKLYPYNNKLTGEIPVSLENLTNLRWRSLYNSNLASENVYLCKKIM